MSEIISILKLFNLKNSEKSKRLVERKIYEYSYRYHETVLEHFESFLEDYIGDNDDDALFLACASCGDHYTFVNNLIQIDDDNFEYCEDDNEFKVVRNEKGYLTIIRD